MPKSSFIAWLTKLIPQLFSYNSVSTSPKTYMLTGSHQFLEIYPLAQIDSKSFVDTDIDSSPPSLKKDGNSPPSLAVLYLFSKPSRLITILFNRDLVSSCTVSLPGRDQRLTVTVGQLNCSLKCSAQKLQQLVLTVNQCALVFFTQIAYTRLP